MYTLAIRSNLNTSSSIFTVWVPSFAQQEGKGREGEGRAYLVVLVAGEGAEEDLPKGPTEAAAVAAGAQSSAAREREEELTRAARGPGNGRKGRAAARREKRRPGSVCAWLYPRLEIYRCACSLFRAKRTRERKKTLIESLIILF
jgi:hypothetical protein